ncbi:hypothetical protein BZG76_09725 [Salinivibrio sp. AR647]|uniref:glycosyltransferase n=1 Tax=Salinivibrio sp. AR647 TaxID=1909438 RepID=UPI000985AA54|nr:glycosyltransferase [Salinivibrio sp. AR647]OOE91663.1 hypothetical protein BZG76_09725 [Salinivibrio sp. AR647]
MIKNNIPLVSVVITTYNRLELLERAIDSVLKQDYPHLEIIVSDDCSDVDVMALVERKKKYTSIPIHYRRNDSNQGACYSRNEGIKMSSGFFVAGLDDDDEFTSDRISYLVSHYNPKYSLVTSNTLVVSKQGIKSLFSKKNKREVYYKDFLWENMIGTQVLTERSRFLDIGGFDTNLTSAQDADMWIRLIKEYGPALRLGQEKYILHTEHEENRISVSENKLKGLSDFHKKHSCNMSNSQIKYSRFKYQRWSNNLTFLDLLRLDFNCLIFVFKKKLKLL